MDPLWGILAVLGSLGLGAMSPGPSFVYVVRISLAHARRGGIAAALGMGAGGFLYAVAALLGLQGVLHSVPEAYVFLRIAGGLYLLYLAVRVWKAARIPLAIPHVAAASTSHVRIFLLAFGTQLSNPKTALVYAGAFAAFLPQPAAATLFVLPPLVFLLESGWYAIVAVAFSLEAPRIAYVRSKKWVDRAAGAALGTMGTALLLKSKPAS